MKSIVLCDDTNPEKVLPLCERYNLGIEIQGFYDPNETHKKDELLSFYKEILPNGIEKHFHAPFWDLCLGSANNKIVDVTEYYFDYAYDIADELGCQSITVHHGFIPNTSYPTNWIKRSVKFWEKFFTEHSGNIKIYMENQCETDPETLIGIVDNFSSDRLGVNLDIGHAHCNSDLTVTDWIKQLNNRIKYVHIHSNNGKSDQHLGLKHGNIKPKRVLAALEKYAPDAVWALECKLEYMQETVEYLGEIGYIK